MSISWHPFLSVCGLFFVFVAFLLQVVALSTTWWATFSARTDLGKPKEDGHYGLWSVCSTKGSHWSEDCDPLDTFFQVPSYLQISGIMGIFILLILLPLGSLWAVQLVRNMPYLHLKPLNIAKVFVALLSVIFAILVATFASVGENSQSEYSVEKGWSFWLQISVIGAEIAVTMVCIIEYWRHEHVRQHADPEGTRAETYGNPTFDADSPKIPRRINSDNGAIAYTESSGLPYDSVNGSSNKLPNENPVLTYENECFREHSPNLKRVNRM